MYQRSWIRLKHGLDSEGLSGSINSAKPFQPKSEQKEVWLSSPCSAVSAVTRPVIIHRFGGGGWEGNVLKWMLWSRWHSYVGEKRCWSCVDMHSLLSECDSCLSGRTLSILSWSEWLWDCKAPPCKLSIYSIYPLSRSLCSLWGGFL